MGNYEKKNHFSADNVFSWFNIGMLPHQQEKPE